MTVDKKQIEHPEHYARMQVVIEPRHLTELFTGNISNVLKYLCRAGFKEGESREKDLLKARQYALFAIETDYAYDKYVDVNIEDFGGALHNAATNLPKGLTENTVRVKCWVPHKPVCGSSRYAIGVVCIMRSKVHAIDMLFRLSCAGSRTPTDYNTQITSAGLIALVHSIEDELGINQEKDHA